MIGKTIGELTPGDHAEIVQTVTHAHIASFIDAVGDFNPVHSDPVYAAGTPFKEPIAPGIYTAGLVSAVIGTRLPGPGAVYVSQSLKFTKPVKAGDTITARVEILEVIRERNRIRLRTRRRQRGLVRVPSSSAPRRRCSSTKAKPPTSCSRPGSVSVCLAAATARCSSMPARSGA